MSRSSSQAGSSRRFLLRERTAEAHEALDRMIGPFDSLDAYKRYLVGIGAFRAPIEARLRQALWPAALETFPLQEFSLLIQHDQEDLGIVPPAFPADAGAASDGREHSAATLLGTLYVLEGSALGARLLYQRAQALGLSESRGARHLAAQAMRSDRWSRFLHTLEAADAIEIDEVALASRAAFAEAREAFRQALHGA
ncbi:hypothetical protein BTR14_21565 [Rhizobium rhizosphaerae]|uniref:Heme oxygenase n=1 Tax=Xaviernesmea rhizosphaerae TaxID=1672749 RepID=A0ABX3P7K8_9HYPH|nr:biliverdin-producing heme oxygenase [Xaviernesmea rhizosphaerae]OQP83817.1 hypothetical protein BTR14_21565 [Xaviernesmea rhizosphaerae]